jgi:hypothetical protein
MESKEESRRLYYIESYSSMNSEGIELFTWEDARDVLNASRRLRPEQELVIREFVI